MGKKKKVMCDPRDCGIEETVEKVFNKFSEVTEKLVENQGIMQVQIQRLTDNIEVIGKVEKRMDKIEEKVDRNSVMVWKMVGIGMAGAIAGPLLLSKLFSG